MKTSRTLMFASVVCAAAGHRAEAVTFDTSPAVVAKSVPHSGFDGSTVIFGGNGGSYNMLARQGPSKTVWKWGPSELIGITGGYDSSPTAT